MSGSHHSDPTLFGQPAPAPPAHEPPAAVRERTEAKIAASVSPHTPARAAASDRLEAIFCAYLRTLGAGGTFFSPRFTDYAEDRGARGVILDRRAVGAVVNTAARRGVIEKTGAYAMVANRGCNATGRPEWRVVRVPGGNALPGGRP